MATATFDGKLHHIGIGGDPVVVLTVLDEGPFEDWLRTNRVFTQIVRHRDPATQIERMSIYVTEGAVAGISDGTPVSVTVDVRPEKRGNGVAIVQVAVKKTDL